MAGRARSLAAGLAVLLWLTVSALAQQGSVANDKAVLEALYTATHGANWTDGTNWSSDEPLSSWHGVSTDEEGRVTDLDLRENGLQGPLPTELENLDRLESLHLDGNYTLTGSLPSGIRGLSRLETVAIERTELCVTDDGGLKAWLNAVRFTGLVCPPAEQSVIDVAVFYTSTAREEAGGVDEIRASIDLVAAETNAAYEVSGVNQRIRLVAVEELVGYTQDDDLGISGAGSELYRLRSASDGHMDEVHEIRDAVAADIVLLVRAGFGGVATAIGRPSTDFESYAFGVASLMFSVHPRVRARAGPHHGPKPRPACRLPRRLQSHALSVCLRLREPAAVRPERP